MDILMLLVISPLLFFSGQFVAKKLKIAPPIFYLIVGVLLGGSVGVFHLFGNTDILPNLVNYNNVALWLMFFGAGFNIDVKKMKSSGKLTTNLATLPVYSEAIIMTLLVFIALSILPLGFKLNIPQIALIMLLFAGASPANVIPACTSLNISGHTGKNRITDTMIAASILDNFTPFPLMTVALVLIAGPAMGMSLSLIMLIAAVIGVVLALGFVTWVSMLFGKLEAKLLGGLSDKVMKDPNNKKLGMIYTLCYFGITAGLILLSGPLKSLGVLLVVGIGMGVNQGEKNKIGAKVGFNASMIFAIFGSPIIFAYVGSMIDMSVLLNPLMLGFGLFVTFGGIFIKGLVTKLLLKDEKFSDGDKKFAMSCFVPKGIILVNFSLVLMGPLEAIGMGYVIEFMIILAAISIVASVPLGVTLMAGAKDKWMKKYEEAN